MYDVWGSLPCPFLQKWPLLLEQRTRRRVVQRYQADEYRDDGRGQHQQQNKIEKDPPALGEEDEWRREVREGDAAVVARGEGFTGFMIRYLRRRAA